jgi:hypothetical protein
LHAFLIPLVQGSVLVLALLGIGKLALRLLHPCMLPWQWRLAFVAILGQATLNFLVQLLLISGTSSILRLKILGLLIIGVGIAGHVPARKDHASQLRVRQFRNNNLFKLLLALIWLTNLTVALAPSSKIDDVFYHMIVPKRIATEGTMNFYRLPIEAAIVPQMQYQISLSPAYALGAPEAGNVLSLSYSIILGLFIVGFIQEATRNDSLALLGGLGSVVGAYQTVWHTTEGPTAIGDLALVVAACGVLWPEQLLPKTTSLRYGVLVITAASLAASTKISLIPLCLIISLLAAWRCERHRDASSKQPIRIGVLLLPWILMHLPLMAWTYHESGSFWGPVMANVIRPSIFPAEILRILDQMRIINQVKFLSNLRFAAAQLSPLIFVGIGLIIWTSFRGCRAAAIVLSLLVFQAVLIWWKLPYDFRFLGGLLYIPLIASVLSLTRRKNGELHPANLTAVAERTVDLRNWIAVTTVLPWLLFQMYYARPFAEAVVGISTRTQFRDRFIALSQDYDVLNRILPDDAVLYIANGRVSLFDAPRPVVLTPLDLRQNTSIYRLTVSPIPDQETVDGRSLLNCSDLVYSNSHALVQVYRFAGKLPEIGMVMVRKCRIEQVQQNKLP